MSEPKPIVGIDLGTTNSVVSVLDENKLPQTLLINDAKLLPSVVSLTDKGFIVGQVAKNMAILEPKNTVSSIKRKMGQNTRIAIGDMELKPEEISAVILKKIKAAAVQYLKLDEEEALRAVITVPAYFTEGQRQATRDAAELGGLTVERIINEPTAAALAFGISKLEEAVYTIYDFGGGTFDVSVIESMEGLVEVLATTGDNQLGGDDLDHLLAEHIWNTFLKKNNLNRNTKRSEKEMARLIRIAEQTKIKLSSSESVEVQESFFFNIDNVNYHLEQTITKTDFEELIRPKVQETIEHLKKAVLDAQLELEELDGIILVGGTSRIPLISEMIEEQLRILPTLIDLPDEAVSHGATIQGAIINKIDIDTILVDITPHTLGIGVLDDLSMNLDFLRHLEMGNLEPKRNLGAAALITKNTPVPARRSNKFHAATEYQTGYRIKVYQGEGLRLHDNKQIGELHLEVKKPILQGEIEVFFELDLNGILEVTAVETTTKEQVSGEFKSTRGKKIKKSKLDEIVVLSMDESENTLITRANKVLADADIGEEDKDELQELVEKFKTEQLSKADTSSIEEEILDLLYYLEGDE